MEYIKTQYYPEDKEFTEVSIRFFGSRTNVTDLKCYFNLLSLNKKLKIKFPNYIVDNNFLSYGNFFKYGFRTILNEEEKINNVKLICNELIKYGLKTNIIPIIEFIMYEENNTTIYNLKDYLQLKGIELEEFRIEQVTEKNKILVR